MYVSLLSWSVSMALWALVMWVFIFRKLHFQELPPPLALTVWIVLAPVGVAIAAVNVLAKSSSLSLRLARS